MYKYCLFLLSILYFSFCNSTKKPNYSKETENSITNNINKLSYYCYYSKSDSANLLLNNLLSEDSLFIEHLITRYKGDKTFSLHTFWGDLSQNDWKYKINSYSVPNNEQVALFIICAISYKDYFFAFDRYIYIDNCINIKKDSLYSFSEYSNCVLNSRDINFDEIWELIIKWKKDGMKGRPFGNSSYYWLGEKGGKLTRFNVKMNKIH